MDGFAGARMGPIPLPYVSAIVLLPLWIFFSIGESSLLYSICVIVTVLLKGSLLSRWVIYKFTPFLQWVLVVSWVIILEIYIISQDLQISIFPLVLLVPLSTISGIGIFVLHLDSRKKGTSTSQVIGIFSRSSSDDYSWLMAALRPAGKVVPFYITNSNFSEFRQQVSQCTLAILYHSKTRGRLNITDVTDSLYDEEVKYMSSALGREKVLVVVDDLDDGSDTAKKNILQSQRTIYDQTRDLYLFTSEEKRDKERARLKLQPLLNTLTQGSSSSPIADVIEALILCAPWLHYIFGVYHGVILILSNLGGSLLLANFLLPFSQSGAVLPLSYPIDRPKRSSRGTKKGSRQAGLPALLLVVVLELSAVYWYCSGMKAVLLAAQSVSTLLYAALTSSSSSSSSSPPSTAESDEDSLSTV